MYAGAKSPETLTLYIDDPALDMTTVTSVSLSVAEPNGTVTAWSWVLGTATTTRLPVTHTFDGAGAEAAAAGNYRIYGTVTSPAGVRRIARVIVNFKPYP